MTIFMFVVFTVAIIALATDFKLTGWQLVVLIVVASVLGTFLEIAK